MLTYADRLKYMRETKIWHTLEKKEQNGYTDADDYGTVPVSKDYFMSPWYNSSHKSFFGYEGMSENFSRIMDAHEPYVDPMEMLCGRWQDMLENYRGDDAYAPKWLENHPQNPHFEKKTGERTECLRWDEARFPYEELKPYFEKYNITSGIDSEAHCAPDYKIGFELGFGGILEKIQKYRGVNPDKAEFYDAEEKCVHSIIRFIERHIDKIDELLKEDADKEADDKKLPEVLRENLKEMRTVCERVKLEPPKTFREVCQWIVFFNCATRIYSRDGAGFQLDGLLYPYYVRDKKAGILDDETAKFLIADLLLTDPHYYQISGVDENDCDRTNPLSYLILEAADQINIACNLTVRYHENCDKKFLQKAVYYLIKNKNGWPRFCNDKALAEGYMRTGADKKDARQRIAVGCNWMCIPGREFPMNDCVKINIAKVFEVALKELRKENFYTIQRLWELYQENLKEAVKATAAGVNLHLDHVWEVTPELVMDLLSYDTLEKGEDISQCAEFFTIGVDGVGLAVVADSFGAIETRIEKEKVLTWEALFEALDNNFQDERIRAIMQSAPKYCQGGTESDRWAVRLAKNWNEVVTAEKMPKGRRLIPGWFSWSRTIEYGSKVDATPNGRRKGEPVSHGANPNPHFRKDGAPTAQAKGIASVQCGWGNTAPLQLEFDPQVSIEQGAVEIVLNLIETHFKLGGTLININVLDGDKLLKAHKNPELYPDLVVRVTGFTAYFITLSPQFRQLVVDRFLEGI